MSAELAAREAELNRLKAEVAHARRDISFGAELQRREAVWWDKQLGREDNGSEPVEVDAA
jgi:hypothetical protein